MVAHSLVPVKLLLGELVGTRMLEESLLKLGVDGVELLESSLLSHDRFWGEEGELTSLKRDRAETAFLKRKESGSN